MDGGSLGHHAARDRRQQVEPVRLGQVSGCRRGDPEVPVLPDDPLRLRIDHDDSVVPVVGDGDHSVRPADGERRTVERPAAGRRPVGPPDRAGAGENVDPAGRVESRDEQLAVGEHLRVGRIRRRCPHRVDEVAVPVEAVYPTADLRDQDAAVGEGGGAVRRAERVRRVVVAARGRAVGVQDAVESVDDQHTAVADVCDHHPVA